MRAFRELSWKYALGELFIVFVGILSAVQVDRWNEHRGEEAALHVYLDRILVDLDADESFLEGLTKGAVLQAEACDQLLDMMGRRGRTPSDDEVRAAVEAVTANGAFPVGVRAGTFQDMLSTGALALIDDAELRNALIAYHEEFPNPQLKGVLEYVDTYNVNPLADLFARHLDQRVLFGSLQAQSGSPLFVTDWDRFSGDEDLARQLRMVSAGAFNTAPFFSRMATSTRSLREQVIEARSR